MRRVNKDPSSKIIINHLTYIAGNAVNNRGIAEILLDEQKSFCAYTDEYISRTDARDIEHFNPTLKNKDEDNFNNWFVVKHQWNKEKSYKWEKYQPIMHPTANDFEKRVVYIEGDYVTATEGDLEAQNLISLLKLDDPALASKRKKYINRKREEMELYGLGAGPFFMALIEDDVHQVNYLRAIREEFGIELWDLLN